MSSPLIGTIINDQYRLIEVLGEGGMGIVYKAEDLNLNDRLCAVKLLKGQTTDPNEAKRFEAELQIISRLRSPHVVQVLNKGYIEGYRLFIVMELLEGEPLSALIKNEGKLQVKRAIQITKGILAGLSEAHEYGVVHRDLKPANIFITRSRARDEITKVLDFGIAKDTNSQDSTGLTSASMIIGTPKYMAPEQFMKEDTDPRTDLYAVGLLLYQMLAGRPPYEATSPLVPDTLKRMPSEFKVGWLHMNATPEPISVPPMLWSLCCRLLEKQREDRPESAHEVITELNNILERGESLSGPYAMVGDAQASALESATPAPVNRTLQGYQAQSYQAQQAQRAQGYQAQGYQAQGYQAHNDLGRTLDEDQFQAFRAQLDEIQEVDYIAGDVERPKRSRLAVFAVIAVVLIGGAAAYLSQPKGSARSGGTCFDRVVVSPPGQYQISQASINAQGQAQREISLGKTNLRGALNTIISRGCQERLRVQAKRQGFTPVSLDLTHTDKGKTRSHTLKAEKALGASKLEVKSSGQESADEANRQRDSRLKRKRSATREKVKARHGKTRNGKTRNGKTRHSKTRRNRANVRPKAKVTNRVKNRVSRDLKDTSSSAKPSSQGAAKASQQRPQTTAPKREPDTNQDEPGLVF